MSVTDNRPVDLADDGIQHGIDDNPHDDPKKGAALGGVGGAVVGAAAGAMVGPVGAVIGAVVGGVTGAAASGAAVAAIDDIDNDNNISGLGDDVTADVNYADADNRYDANRTAVIDRDISSVAPLDPVVADDRYAVSTPPLSSNIPGSVVTGSPVAGTTVAAPLGSDLPGVQTGGHAIDGTPDTRGMSEKAADAITGDHIDDKTGKVVR